MSVIVEPGRQNERGWQGDPRDPAGGIHRDIAVTQETKVDAGGDGAHGHEQDRILRLDEPEERRLAVANIDDPFDVVLDRLESREVAHRDHDARR